CGGVPVVDGCRAADLGDDGCGAAGVAFVTDRVPPNLGPSPAGARLCAPTRREGREGPECRGNTGEEPVAKATQLTPGLADAEAVRLVARLIEEQVVVLDTTMAQLEARGTEVDRIARASATAAVAASLMSVSLAVNHVVSRMD